MPSEFELIARHFTRPVRHTVLGVGDDGAVIDYRPTHRRPHPFAFAVDPLRRGDEEDGRMVLLGVTELWIGARRLRTPTWFALVPEGP